MAKPIAIYSGGIHYLIQGAVRADGTLFERTQGKGPYGYAWGKWKECGKVDINNLPKEIPAGFSTLRRSEDRPFGARLPN